MVYVLCDFKAIWHQEAYFSVFWIHHGNTSCWCLYFAFLVKVLTPKSYWNILVLFEYVPRKNVWFGFNSIVWVHFSHKIEKFQFWKSLKCLKLFLINKGMVSDLNMSHGKMSDFVSLTLFGLTLVKKLRKFDFKGH